MSASQFCISKSFWMWWVPLLSFRCLTCAHRYLQDVSVSMCTRHFSLPFFPDLTTRRNNKRLMATTTLLVEETREAVTKGARTLRTWRAAIISTLREFGMLDVCVPAPLNWAMCAFILSWNEPVRIYVIAHGISWSALFFLFFPPNSWWDQTETAEENSEGNEKAGTNGFSLLISDCPSVILNYLPTASRPGIVY